jgi:hypothetical protein
MFPGIALSPIQGIYITTVGIYQRVSKKEKCGKIGPEVG